MTVSSFIRVFTVWIGNNIMGEFIPSAMQPRMKMNHHVIK